MITDNNYDTYSKTQKDLCLSGKSLFLLCKLIVIFFLIRITNELLMKVEWESFKNGLWQQEITIQNFIELNYEEYTGNEEFLVGPTEKTRKVWNKCEELLKEE